MATGSPGTNGVWQYGEDDSEATFSALLNKAASTTDTAIGLDRGRLTTLEARKLASISPVIPSAVTVSTGSGSFNGTTGVVTFTNANDINLNGIFTTAYRYYQISFTYKASSGGAFNLLGFFTNNGTNISTGYYGASFYSNFLSNSGVAEPRNNAANMVLGSAGQEGDAHTDAQVAWASGSAFTSIKYTNYNLSVAQNLLGGYNVGLTTVNGLRLSTGSSRTLTGTMRVMGYN
jgi:hypothetical protein